MKIKELIEKLKEADPDSDIYLLGSDYSYAKVAKLVLYAPADDSEPIGIWAIRS